MIIEIFKVKLVNIKFFIFIYPPNFLILSFSTVKFTYVKLLIKLIRPSGSKSNYYD